MERTVRLMHNIGCLFMSDLRHLFANVMSAIIAVGLAVMPSLFAWFNIIACWNVFDNTGNVTIAVANADEGYQSDLIPIKVNIGEEVVSALRENDQIHWVFMGEEEAKDKARSGECYAAVVIPPEFSRDMLTFYADGAEHAQLIYYSNEKKNAISPKVTDTGADTISYEVNRVFAKTLSEISLSLARSLSAYADELDADGRIADLAEHMHDLGSDIHRVATVAGLYADLLRTGQQVIADCSHLISVAKDEVASLFGAAEEGGASLDGLGSAVSSGADLMDEALKSADRSIDQVIAAADRAFQNASGAASSSASDMRNQADSLDSLRSDLSAAADTLDALATSAPAYGDPLRQAAERMREAAQLVEGMQEDMRRAADGLEAGVSNASASHDEAKAKAQEAKEDLADVRREFDETLRPGLDALAERAESLSSDLGSRLSALDGVAGGLEGSAQSLSTVAAQAIAKIDEAEGVLHGAADKVQGVGDALESALAAGDRDALRSLLSEDAGSLAYALSSPVGIERHAVFASKNFGSAMAPFYSTLGIFIGSLLILVAIKPNVSPRALRILSHPRPHQLFFGRFCVMVLLSLAQTTLMGLGDLWFLQVQVSDPWLFMLCFWFTGLVFTFLIYALVSAFANLGKALAVVLLIMQVTGCGGSYPLQMLPSFVQALSPYLPASHAVSAMRAAMFGVFQNDYWTQMGELALFLIPAALIGLVLRKPFERFMHWYVREVESTDVIA